MHRCRLFLMGLCLSLPILLLAGFLAATGILASTALEATKTATLLVDHNANDKVDPGDVLGYSVTITNAGDSVAQGVVFSDTLDAGVSLVPGSLRASPLAGDDEYETFGNTLLVVSTSPTTTLAITSSVPITANDRAFLGDTFTIVHMDQTSALGGSVTDSGAGEFTYMPPAGFTGRDVFSYTIESSSGLQDTGVVALLVRDVIWYVNNAVEDGGDGRSTHPFKVLSAAESASTAGDTIYVFHGDGTSSGLNTGFVLQSGQRLIGEGVELSYDRAMNEGSAPTRLLPAGARPALNGVVRLTSIENAEVAGVAITSTTNALQIAGASRGQIVIRDNILRADDRAFEATKTDSTFRLDLSFTRNRLFSSGAQAAWIENQHNNYFVIEDFADNLVDPDSAGGIEITMVQLNANPGGALLPVAGGVLTIGSLDGPVTGRGLHLMNVHGSLRFEALSIFNTNGVGLDVTKYSSYPLSFQAVGGSQVHTSGGPAVRLTGSTAPYMSIDLPSMSLSSSDSPTGGVELNGVSGTFSAGSTSSISGASGTAIHLSNLSPSSSINFAGSIQNGAGRSVVIDSAAGSSITFSGSITDTALGIQVTPGHLSTSVHFSGGLNLSTGAQDAFVASGSGTLSVTGNNNVIQTTSGVALKVSGQTIAPAGLSFRHISSGSGSQPAIQLSNTGAQGGLTITGDGTTGSGGLISNRNSHAVSIHSSASLTLSSMDLISNAGSGMYIENSGQITLERMSITGNTGSGIHVSSGEGFTLISSAILGNSVALDGSQANLRFHNLTGSALISDTIVSNSPYDNIRITADSGTLNQLTVAGSTIGPNSATTGNNGITVIGDGTASIRLVLQDETVLAGHRAAGLLTSFGGNSVQHISVQGSTIRDNNVGIDIGHWGAGGWSADISDTTLLRHSYTPINLFANNSSLVWGQATIRNNGIGDGNPDSGSKDYHGIQVSGRGNAGLILALEGNQISRTEYTGILVTFGDTDGSSAQLHLTLAGNTVSAPEGTDWHGVQLIAREQAAFCADVRNNNSAGSGAGAGYYLHNGGTSTFSLTGYQTDVPTTLSARNNSGSVSSAGAFTPGACQTVAWGASTHPGDALTSAAPTPAPGPLPRVFHRPSEHARPLLPLTFVDTEAIEPAPMSATLSEIGPLEKSTVTPLSGGKTWVGLASLLASVVASPMSSPGETISVDLGDLPAGKTVTITFRATVVDPFLLPQSTVSNQGEIRGANFESILTDDPTTPEVADPTVVQLNLEADVGISKTAVSEPIVPGSPLTYTIVVTNAGPHRVLGARVLDLFADTLDNVQWTCWAAGDSDCGATEGTGNIDQIIDLTVGGWVTYSVSSTVPSGVIGAITNTAVVTLPVYIQDPTPDNNSDSVVTTLTPQADLAISKHFDGSSIFAGDTLTFTIGVTNAGPSDAPGVVVSDTFSSSLSFLEDTCGGSVSDGWTWSLGSMPAGSNAHCQIAFSLSASAAGTLTNTVVVTSAVPDLYITDNTAAFESSIDQLADLEITKTATPADAVPGDIITFTIAFTNHGPTAAVDVRITDTVPAGLTDTGWSHSGVSITQTGETDYIWDADELLPGAGGIITITGRIRSDAGGTILHNNVLIGSSIPDPDEDTNEAGTTTPVLLPIAGAWPPGNSAGIDPTSTVRLHIQGNIDPEDIHESWLVVFGSQSGLVEGTLRYDAGVGELILEPDNPFLYGELVLAVGTDTIRSPEGVRVAAPHSWQFRIGRIDAGLCAGGFLPLPNGLPDLGGGAVAWADYDGNGRPDILLTGEGLPASLYENVGDGSFSLIDELASPGRNAVAWGDYNRSGNPDLALAGGGYTVILANAGDGSFTVAQELVGVSNPSLVWGDFFGDGWLDLLVAGEGSSGHDVWLYRNQGTGVLTLTETSLSGMVGVAADAADFDKDGWIDLVIVGERDGQFVARVYRNLGNGSFSLWTEMPGAGHGSVHVADFDQDGWSDILLTGADAAGAVTRLYRNEGDGSFSLVDAGLPAVAQGAARWGDFDNDGFPDIAMTGIGSDGQGIAKVFRSNGDETFSLFTQLPGLRDAGAAWGDYDGDDRLDLLLHGLTESDQPVSRLYRNVECANLVLNKTASSATARSEEGASFFLSFSNQGEMTAADVVLTDTLPAGFLFQSYVESGLVESFSAEGSILTWEIHDLEQEAGGVITVTGKIGAGTPSGSRLINEAIITTSTSESSTEDNRASAEIDVREDTPSNLLVFKGVDWNNTAPNPQQFFTICVTGASFPDESCKTTGYAGGLLTWSNILPGSYTVREQDPGAEWSVEYISADVVIVPRSASVAVGVRNIYYEPTPTPTATLTPTPAISITYTPTVTLTPTPTATFVPRSRLPLIMRG